MSNKSGRTKQRTNNIGDELIWVTDIFNEKRERYNHRCPDSVYFNTLS